MLQKIITIAEIQNLDGRTVVKDTEGKSFSFFNNKQSGEPSVASKTFQSGQIKPGWTGEVNYAEEQYVNKMGKNVTSKKITSFGLGGSGTAGTPTQTQSKAKSGDVDWDAIATGKIASNLLTSLVAAGKSLDDVSQMIPQAYKVAQSIMDYPSSQKPPESHQAQSSQNFDEEMTVEEIPF